MGKITIFILGVPNGRQSDICLLLDTSELHSPYWSNIQILPYLIKDWFAAKTGGRDINMPTLEDAISNIERIKNQFNQVNINTNTK